MSPFDNPSSSVSRLEASLPCDWQNIRAAKSLAEAKRTELRNALTGLDSEDTSIVVSGSLARDEFTKGSDIDWSLLVDGSADPKHHDLRRKIGELIRPLMTKPPGREGTFAATVFSHDLVHEIGGENDTNQNTTRRLLLLLESRAVGRDDAYRRVTRHILSRYLQEDRGLWRNSRYHVPRFLQNDFARYWRTITVDFAYKIRDRAGQGWAIRNMKLRMSRKLIYVSGLLACFCCHFKFAGDPQVFTDPGRNKEVAEYLQELFDMTSLEIVAHVLVDMPHLAGAARKIFDSYDGFLGIIADENKRKRLEELKEEEAEKDGVYQEVREYSHVFMSGLLEFFFDIESGMNELTKNYGVF
jgi:predicted nucleotidyltransferase